MAMTREAPAWKSKFDKSSVLLAKQELGSEQKEVIP
jgi:hypothetical protein